MIGSANRQGGGLYVYDGIVSITNSTIANNLASEGGGIFNQDSSPITLFHTILADNSIIMPYGYPNTHNCSGPVVSGGYNLEDGDHCTLSGAGDRTNLDPLLQALTLGSAWPPVQPLAAGSPAIDKGNNAICPAVDQRGVARPFDGDGNGVAVCDIGAVEYP
jgi:hypothetical protein